MKFFVNLGALFGKINGKSIGFWFCWMLLGPLVFLRFVFSDLVNLRLLHSTARVKTSLVRISVYQQLVKGK